MLQNFAQSPRFTHCSKGLVRVPHQVKMTDRPTVSNSLARTLTPTCSSARFSTNSWLKNYSHFISTKFVRISLKVTGGHTVGALVAAKIKPPR